MKLSCKNIYKVFRMIIIFIMVTYFVACFYYYLSKNWNTDEDRADGNTFLQKFGFDGEDYYYYLLSICYYVSTTINIIGYGELTPKSDIEKVFIIFLMFTG